MATRARIGIQTKSGRIIGAYQHWDGYPGGLGYNLVENWNDPKKVTAGIKLGDSSKWHYIVGDTIDFDDREDEMYDVQNVYYGRDRGEKDCQHKSYKDEADFLARGFNSGEQYVYLMKQEGEQDFLGRPQGTWYYAESVYTKEGKEVINGFKPLEQRAVEDHIQILTDSYKLNKKRKVA